MGLQKEMPEMTVQQYNSKGDTWPKILTYNYQEFGAKRAMRYKTFRDLATGYMGGILSQCKISCPGPAASWF